MNPSLREQALEWIAAVARREYDRQGWQSPELASAFAALSSAPDDYSGWIACSERMPTTLVPVQVYGQECGVTDGTYVGETYPYGRWLHRGDMITVTHWMPLPAPPVTGEA